MNIEKNVKEIIAKQLKIKESDISNDSDLEFELGIDSLDMMSIILKFEEVFKINIDVENIKDIETVEDIINYIKDLTNETK